MLLRFFYSLVCDDRKKVPSIECFFFNFFVKLIRICFILVFRKEQKLTWWTFAFVRKHIFLVTSAAVLAWWWWARYILRFAVLSGVASVANTSVKKKRSKGNPIRKWLQVKRSRIKLSDLMTFWLVLSETRFRFSYMPTLKRWTSSISISRARAPFDLLPFYRDVTFRSQKADPLFIGLHFQFYSVFELNAVEICGQEEVNNKLWLFLLRFSQSHGDKNTQ